MIVKLWGTRGSLPRPEHSADLSSWLIDVIAFFRSHHVGDLDDFAAWVKDGGLSKVPLFGGDTACTSFQSDSGESATTLIVDAGSGLRRAQKICQDHQHLFLTHMHIDHLIGLPFYEGLYRRGHKLTIYHVHPHAPKAVQSLFDGVFFPLRWNQLIAEIDFVQLPIHKALEVEDFIVTPFVLDHPGGCFGYRFDRNGKSAAVGFDGEFKRKTPAQLGPDGAVLTYLDVLIFDAQYEEYEMVLKHDWGHSTGVTGVEVALQLQIAKLVLVHHDPNSQYDKLKSMVKVAQESVSELMHRHPLWWKRREIPSGPKVINGYDGLEIRL